MQGEEDVDDLPQGWHEDVKRKQRIEFLERHRQAIKAHMLTRQEDQDWHGVSDDANDLREVDAELRGLRFMQEG